MTPPPRQSDSRLETLLRARQFAITAEITPPVACEAEELLRKAQPLAGTRGRGQRHRWRRRPRASVRADRGVLIAPRGDRAHPAIHLP